MESNLPFSIMHLECDSFWGPTTNPYNTSLTPGGKIVKFQYVTAKLMHVQVLPEVKPH